MCSVLVMTFMLSLFSQVAYASEEDFNKVQNNVKKTKSEIDALIYESIKNAEKEIMNYLKELEILEKGKETVKLEKEISNLNEELTSLDINKDDYNKKLEKTSTEITKK